MQRTPRARGVRGGRWTGWEFVLPALIMYGAFVLVPLLMTVQYSTLRWNGIGKSEFVGIDNYVKVLTDPALLGIIGNAFKLIFFFSVVPVALGLLIASLIRRVASGPTGAIARTVLFLPQVNPAGRGRHRLAPDALQGRPHQPVPVGHRPRGITRAWLADFDLALPAVGVNSGSGCSSASARSCSSRA